MLSQLKALARGLKAEVYALYLVSRHPGTPWHAKLLIVAIVAYAVSPVDLIPDFIPVLGLLDDAVLLPLGIALALKLVPAEVMSECRARALAQPPDTSSVGRVAGAVIVLLWIALAVALAAWAHVAFAFDFPANLQP